MDRVPVTQLLRQVAPWRASSGNPEHRVQHAAVVSRRTPPQGASLDYERLEEWMASTVVHPSIFATAGRLWRPTGLKLRRRVSLPLSARGTCGSGGGREGDMDCKRQRLASGAPSGSTFGGFDLGAGRPPHDVCRRFAKPA